MANQLVRKIEEKPPRAKLCLPAARISRQYRAEGEFEMGAWLTWAILGLLLMALEMVTPSFFIIFFGIGALAASAVAALGYGIIVQLLAFVVTTLTCFVFLRKYTLKMQGGPTTATNYEALVGKLGIVTKTIALETGLGQVRVRGEDWSALAETSAEIAQGEMVEVLAVSGVRLVVRRAHER